ncbi:MULTISPECIES: type VI secretion system-associated FHA domain protein TagH [Marinobacter]|uniref:Type VI secretion system-associated FHA domain protein TagH n=1 Tax=Marinobacter xiaoshiensis TaxID=3073652 RepID=A0ABU2HIQ2_9GAMM|nr:MULTISPECIES: type VI secretion system-associated FHA domain protein TagH [unclassified Marinobacter]MBK1886496.1 type VI secretion system-associated FHA domain protein TagH [Marinobacter sp. DY40_1A1]MDS1310902.1 type VI secretion system-associated FHA domain protein TagH [Marinobacter sp. F60267]
MEERQVTRLKLTVTNPGTTRSGAGIEHSFGPRGGSIGTAESDTWQLSAHRTGAVAGHAEIRLLDGGYCLIDRSGRTYINSATQPVGRGRRARLNQGDTVSIGRYRIRAELIAAQAGSSTEQELELREAAEDRRLVDMAEGELVRGAARDSDMQVAEPLEGLASAAAETPSADPMLHWQDEPVRVDQEERTLMASERAWFATETDVTDEYRENRDVAMGLPVRRGERDRMSETHNGALGEGSGERSQPHSDQSRKHISATPLMQGMEAGLDFADSDGMQLFLEEAGQTLKATIDGLLALHQGEDSRHQALRTRLQPIEDNPLRLGGDYEETVQTLFASQRSPVHLSAPAAVQESLQSLNHHQQATGAAISEALEAILHAFSPEALLRRFHGYRRGLQKNEDEGRWAWDMYQHYYKELKSSRQQGFERLFQEVFDQAYDQHLRQLQRENLV